MLTWVGLGAVKIEQVSANQLYFFLQYHTLILGLMFFWPPLAQGGAYVNGPEILHLIRHDLQAAVARQEKPPTPRPMDASPWVAMSAMQKAIRRGREDLALSAAATLLRDAPDKLWRRVGCIYRLRGCRPGGLGHRRDRNGLAGREAGSRGTRRRMGGRQLRCR
jgi:hypothetical protein